MLEKLNLKVDYNRKKMYQCALCPYLAKTLSMYNRHLKIHSESGCSRPFPCPHPGCSYAAKQRSKLKRHSKLHSDETTKLVCPLPRCNFSTNEKEDLVLHMRRHTGEKPYKCQFESCSFATVTQNQLVVHSRTHTKERPYKCPEENCEYSATQMSKIKRHQLTHSPKEGEERPSFSCPICEYTGKSKDCLSQHIKSHTHEKLFKCDEPNSNCNFEAKSKGAVKKHKLSKHSDEKPFACSVESCEFRCKVKPNLSNHLKTHSDQRQYKCGLCPFRGKTKGVVASHLKHVHADPNFRPFRCTESECDYAAKRSISLKTHLLTHTRGGK